jgi:hypothetical protein
MIVATIFEHLLDSRPVSSYSLTTTFQVDVIIIPFH